MQSSFTFFKKNKYTENHRNSKSVICIICYRDGKEHWIGLRKADGQCSSHDLDTRRTGWQWEGNTPYEYPFCHDWITDRYGDPDKGECCATISTKGWYGLRCNRAEHYICEKGMHQMMGPCNYQHSYQLFFALTSYILIENFSMLSTKC